MLRTIGLVGFGGELLRALARAGRRSRTFAELALVALLIGAPNVTFVADHWATPETTMSLPRDPRITFRMSDLVVAEQPTSRASPIARGNPVATPAPVRTPQPVATPAPAAPAPKASSGAWVYASWYGPGFYGNRTACGQTFTTASWGVAHKTLRCGTTVQITYRGKTVSAPVIDRGPYVAGREVDLSSAVAGALGFTGVQLIYLVIP